MSKAAIPTVVLGLVAAISIVAWNGFAQADDAAEPEAEAERIFTLRVIQSQTKEPVPDVGLEVAIDRSNRYEITDAQGQCVISLPVTPLQMFRIKTQKEGLVPMQVTWRANDPIPAEYTLALEPGTSIGGIIQDEAGKPIADASVYLLVPGEGYGRERPSIWDEVAMTDEAGKWRCDIMPSKLDDLWIRLQHPDFVSDVMYGSTPKPPMEKLRDMTGVMVMKKGLAVSGTVVDGQGAPVSGAIVAQGSDRWGTEYPSTSTDAEGRFQFDNANPGRMVLTVQQKGYAPELADIQVGPGLEPVRFTLKPGATIKGRFVDPDGNPMPGISIVADTWRGHRSIQWRAKTDAEGRFAWTDAPAEEVQFDAIARDYMAVRNHRMTASDEEYVITMYRPLKVSGSVVDAETKAPIPTFAVVLGGQWGDNQPPYWETHTGLPAFADGRFELTMREPRHGHLVKIEADGYLPAVSRVFKDSEGSVTLDFELVKGQGPTGVVLSPDGNPLAGAEVALAAAGTGFYYRILNGAIANREGFVIVESGLDGRFAFRPQMNAFRVVVLHDQGYAELTGEKLQAKPEVVLTPWARIEGKDLNGTRPVAHERIQYSMQSAFDPLGQTSGCLVWEAECQTDDQGHFALSRLPAGEATVYRIAPLGSNGYIFAYHMPVELKPGEAASVTMGGVGRPIIGKVALPAGSNLAVDWRNGDGSLALKATVTGFPAEFPGATPEEKQAAYVEWSKSEEGRAWTKARNRAVRFYHILLKEDGTFRLEDIPAGAYDLQIRLFNFSPMEARETYPEIIGLASREVVIPEIPGGVSDEPLDLGTIELKPSNPSAHPPGAG